MNRSDVKNKNLIIEECLLSLAEGNKDAMDKLYSTVYSDIYAFALSKVSDRFDAGDILHDTFIRIFENAKLYTPQGKPLVWIFTVENNVINRYYQIRNRCVPLEDEVLYNVASDDSSNDTPTLSMESIEQILKHLNEFEREVILLHIISDLKFREIAEQLDKPLSTVLSKYNRAIKKLQKMIKEEKMNNKKIKKILKQSFINNMSPLMLEKIKNDLNEVKQYTPLRDKKMYIENENKHKVSSLFSKFVFGGAMCAIFAIGLTLGNLFPATRLVSGQETTIYLDVNPSIEIQIDKNEKVIKCISNNKEAEVILENLSLRGVEVDTALYAIVGSMYTNGYLNSETNSILLSVDSDQDNEKSLLNLLTQEINTVFENNKDMECSIIGQKVDVNSEIREKAETNQVSIGKMHLIDKIIENSDLYTNTNEYELCRMSVHELDIIYHSLDEQIKEGDVVSGNPSGFINKSEALDYVIEQLEAFKYEIDAYEIMTIYHYDINLNPHMVYFISIQIEDNKDKQYFIVDCSSGELLPQDIIQDWVEKLYYSK